MKVVFTLLDMISSTEDWMSWSVMRLMWPLRTEGDNSSNRRQQAQSVVVAALLSRRLLGEACVRMKRAAHLLCCGIICQDAWHQLREHTL
jgi:hypothetical protein